MSNKKLSVSLSPHTLQNKKSNYSNAFTRLLTDDFPEEPYRRRRHEDKTLVHVGQRKLHMSEVEFLTICCSELYSKERKQIVVIYAGAAHGHHIPLLINMFPFMDYVLIDPGTFKIDDTRYPKDKIKCEIKNCFMDDKLAEELYHKYKDYSRLYISDIRSADSKTLTEPERERKIVEDMKNQMGWYKIMKPFKTMLKFRLPYVGKNQNAQTKIEYLDGEVHFQLWAGCTSTETRLIVSENAKTKLYDCIKYENQLFRFNTQERTFCYKHDIDLPGIDHCYDCRAEVHIFEEYIQNFDEIASFCKDVQIEKLTVYDYMKQVTSDLNCDKRLIKLIYNGDLHYVLFPSMQYGRKPDEVFTQLTKTIQSEEIKASFRDGYYSDSDEDSPKQKHVDTRNYTQKNYFVQKRRYEDAESSYEDKRRRQVDDPPNVHATLKDNRQKRSPFRGKYRDDKSQKGYKK